MTLPPDQSTVPVCPRHPDRESYVRCQRCMRPVCPECQRQAAVGVQCVDCAREGARSVRTGTTVFGGQPTDGRPIVTWTLIGLCVLGNVLQRVPGLGVTEAFAFVPGLAQQEPWRFLTAAFLHSAGAIPFGLLHIGLNMYALYIIGPYLERLFGRARFLALYLVSAFGGSVGFELLTSNVDSSGRATATVGASGAVFGLFGALLIVQRRLDRQIGQVAVILAVNLVYGFFIPFIAWQAHLGGVAVGALAALVLVNAPRGHRSLVQWSGLAVLTVGLVVLAVLGLSFQFA